MKIIPYLIVGVLSYGCAAKKLAIENADTLLSYQVTKRIPLYSAQKTELNKDIDKLLNTTKPKARELLPIFDELKLNENETIQNHYQQLEKFYQEVAQNFSSIMSKHLARLDPKQQKDFFETLDDENRQLQKKDISSRLEKIEERIELFIGPLTPKQKQIVTDYGDYFEARTSQRIIDRKILHQDFREIYANDISQTTKEDLFREAFKRYQDKRIKDQKTLEIINKFIPTLKDSQHERLRKSTNEVKSLLRYYLDVDY